VKAWYGPLLNAARRHQRVLSASVMSVIFSLLAWRLYRDWHRLPAGLLQTVDYPMLSMSLVCLMGALLLVSARWGLTLRVLGQPLPWRTSVRIWFLSQAGRYLPGGIWPYVSRFHLSQGKMSGSTAALSMVLETLLRVLSEFLVFLCSLPFWLNRSLVDSRILILSGGGVIVGLCLLHPRWVELSYRSTLLRRMGIRMDLEPPCLPHYGAMLGLLAYYMATVLGVGAAFSLLVRAIYPLPWRVYPILTGGLAVSVVVGFLVPLAPGGWGVREGLLTLSLGQIMPTPVAIIISVVCRLWLSLAEGLWILLALRPGEG